MIDAAISDLIELIKLVGPQYKFSDSGYDKQRFAYKVSNIVHSVDGKLFFSSEEEELFYFRSSPDLFFVLLTTDSYYNVQHVYTLCPSNVILSLVTWSIFKGLEEIEWEGFLEKERLLLDMDTRFKNLRKKYPVQFPYKSSEEALNLWLDSWGSSMKIIVNAYWEPIKSSIISYLEEK